MKYPSDIMTFSGRTRLFIGFIVLVLLPLIVYWRVTGNGFITFDDPEYVSNNWMVQQGLTAKGWLWSFELGHASNWHPITWWSHMLDCEVNGLNAGSHHLTNLALHLANTSLLFLLLRRTTAAFWRSALVAGLFALHPMHVESVAWISERKDVLSTFFGLLTLIFYVRYAKAKVARLTAEEAEPTFEPLSAAALYGLTVLFFALGLMSKPMLVTWPFVMLLLDFWPLQRAAGRSEEWTGKPFSRFIYYVAWMKPLLLEKIPFFLLSGISCVLTFISQQKGGAVQSLVSVPLVSRIENALVSYAWYVKKLFWPSDLAILYPYQEWPLFVVIGSTILLIGLTVVVIKLMRQHPYLATGWFFFLGTLVPVIGLVQVGAQFAANRYTYIPYTGLLIMVVWGLPNLLRNKRVLSAAGIAAIATSSILTWRELGYWKNTETLFTRTLAVTKENDIIHNNLGFYLMENGRRDEAAKYFVEALRIDPSHQNARINLGIVHAQVGAYKEAIGYIQEVLNRSPSNAVAQNNMGMVLAAQGSLEEAVPYFKRAIGLDPHYLTAHTECGIVLFQLQRLDEALHYFTKAVELNPRSAPALNNLANALNMNGQPAAAIPYYRHALKIAPNYGNAHYNYADALMKTGNSQTAKKHLVEALRANPQDAAGHYALGRIAIQEKKPEKAMQHFREAMRLQPDFPDPMIRLAWLRATHPEANVRDGSEAMELARRAAKLRPENDVEIVSVEAAAHAEKGEFGEAMAAAEKMMETAKALGYSSYEKALQEQLKDYRSSKPHREESGKFWAEIF